MAISATGATPSLDPNAFLKLFITQVKYQDPTSPMDPSQMMANLAQLTTVQDLTTLDTSFQQALSTEQLRLAQGMIGSQASFSLNGQPQVGMVQAAQIQNGQVGIVVGNQFVPVDSVTQIAPALTNSGQGS